MKTHAPYYRCAKCSQLWLRASWCALVTKQPATQTVHTYPHSLAQSCYKDFSVRHQEEIDASIRQDQKIILEMLEAVSDEDVLRLRTDILRRRFDRISGIRVRTNDSWSALASVVKSVTPQGS